MFEQLKRNISHEKKILQDIKSINERIRGDSENEKFYIESINTLLRQIYLLNKTVPELLKEWSPILQKVNSFSKQTQNKPEEKNLNPIKPLISQKINSNIEVKKEEPRKFFSFLSSSKSKENSPKNVQDYSFVSPSKKEKNLVTLGKEDRKEFLKKLKLSEENLVNIERKKKEVIVTEDKKPNPYAILSNKLFRKKSEKLAPHLEDISNDLKKGNVPFLVSTYISMALFSSLIALILGFFIYAFLLIINPASFWIHIWIPFALVFLTLTAFYLYPASEASSIEGKISYELPFATIHMSAIAGSNIEPTRLFKIIASSKEYPTVGSEMKKVLVQTEIYGYDLVASLKNVSQRTPSKKLAELFSGFATNITTGGELKNFLDKKAENYLLDYKLERQRYSDLAGTFMDVYISILIAAPLVMMMLFIVMNVADMGIGLGINTLMLLSILGISFANIVFLFVLNLKQPKV